MKYKKVLNTVVELLQNKEKKHIHFIGGGGVGMSGLALLLWSQGYHISASDKNDSKYLKQLKKKNIQIWVGSQPKNIPLNAVVFYSSAILTSDVERRHCQKNKIPIFSRHALLYFITQRFFTIVVCGAHGKTTTSSWLAYLFWVHQYPVYALLGGTLKQAKTNVLLGEKSLTKTKPIQSFPEDITTWKPVLIIEGDESDQSLHYIQADIMCVTNIELDHVDEYASEEELIVFYKEYFKRMQEQNKPIYTTKDVDDKLFPFFDMYFQNKAFDMAYQLYEDSSLALPGIYNAKNASLVIQIAWHFKMSKELITQVIDSVSEVAFQGVEKRFDQLYSKVNKNKKRIIVIDDYAHHPTEIHAILSNLERVQKGKKVKTYVFFEPHRLSRLCYFADNFYKVFFLEYSGKPPLMNNVITQLFILPPFIAHESYTTFVEANKILDRFSKEKNVFFCMNPNMQHQDDDLFVQKEIESLTKELIRIDIDTTFLFLGAAHSSKWAHKLVNQLKETIF